MRFQFTKEVKEGSYIVFIHIKETLPIEREKIRKFGSPKVSIEPQRILYKHVRVSALPLHDFNHGFVFTTESEANTFLDTMKNRIRTAVSKLNSLTDKFSGEEEHVF